MVTAQPGSHTAGGMKAKSQENNKQTGPVLSDLLPRAQGLSAPAECQGKGKGSQGQPGALVRADPWESRVRANRSGRKGEGQGVRGEECIPEWVPRASSCVGPSDFDLLVAFPPRD